MFPGALLVLIVLIVLTVKSYRHIQDSKLKRYFKIANAIAVVSLAFCIGFGYLGDRYIENYQNVNGGCPSSYPYSWAVIAAGLVGLAAFAYLAAILFKRKLTMLGFLIIGIAILFALLVAFLWLLTVFCLVF